MAPRPPVYAEAVQQRAAAALERLGPPCPRDTVIARCSALHRLVIDYGELRAKLRAARKPVE